MNQIKISESQFNCVFAELREALEANPSNNTRTAILSAVASLIAGSGRVGGHEQLAVMKLVEKQGFSAEYGTNSIMVSWQPVGVIPG